MNWLLNIFRKTKADPYQMKERFGYIPTISKPKTMTLLFIGFCTAFVLLIGAIAFSIWVVNDKPEKNLTGELEDDILRW